MRSWWMSDRLKPRCVRNSPFRLPPAGKHVYDSYTCEGVWQITGAIRGYPPRGGEMTAINGRFKVASWDESAYEEREGRRLTRASVAQRFEGDIAGEGTAEWLMAYQANGTARFVGL